MTITYLYDFQIGLTFGAMVNVESLNPGPVAVPAPKALYQPCQEYITLGDGSVAGIGLPMVVWQFGWLYRAQRDALRFYCPGVSNPVWLKSQTNDSGDAYGLFTGFAVWPLTEERDAQRRINLNIIFQQLVTH